jgi:transcriptional regulator with XRE-family HTH domain
MTPRAQPRETVGQYIRRLRAVRGKSGQDVVDAVGISNAALCNYEKETRRPSPAILERIVHALDGDWEYALALWLVQHDVRNVDIPEPQDGLPEHLCLTRERRETTSAVTIQQLE